MNNEIAVLGVGMHPWGKWGRNFVEYGVKAARDALEDSGVRWQDVGFVSGAATMRCGYPGYVAGATFAQALGWQGAEVNTSYAACASGSQALAAARFDFIRARGPRTSDWRTHRSAAKDITLDLLNDKELVARAKTRAWAGGSWSSRRRGP